MIDVPALLVVSLMSLASPAPSTFTITGYASMSNCEYARGELARQHMPFGKKIVLWSACIPSGPGSAAAPSHKD